MEIAWSDTGGDDFKAKSADHFEHAVDFMVTIALGAFAVVGYLIKDSILDPGWSRWGQMALAAVAALSGALSLFHGYKNYLNLVAATGSGTFNFATIPDNYAWQALFLLLEGVAIFLVLAITILYRKAGAHAPGP